MRKLYQIVREFKHQLFFSLFGFSGSCRQNPSCSQYTVSQMKKNGTIIGLAQGLWRALHCHH